MTAKNYLRQLRLYDIRINQRIEQLVSMKSRATSISVSTDSERVQASSSGDSLVNAVASYLDLEDKIKQMINVFEQKKDKLITEIQGLDDAKYMEVLYKHYVEFKTFEKIACEMNYSFDYVLKLHGWALHAFEQTYPVIVQ